MGSLPGGMNILNGLQLGVGGFQALKEMFDEREAERKNQEKMNESLNYQAAMAGGQYENLANQYGSNLDFFLGPVQQQSRPGTQPYQPRSQRGTTQTLSPSQQSQQAVSGAAGGTQTGQSTTQGGLWGYPVLNGLQGLLGGGQQSGGQPIAKGQGSDLMKGTSANQRVTPTNISRSDQQQTNLEQANQTNQAPYQQGGWGFPAMSAFTGGGQPLLAGTDPMPLGPSESVPAAVGEGAQDRSGGYFDQSAERLNTLLSSDLGRFGDFASQMGSGLQSSRNEQLGALGTGSQNVLGQAQTGYGQQMMGQGGLLGSMTQGYGQREQDVMAGLGGMQSDVLGQLKNLYGRSMANLKGAGDQERRDIEQSYGQRNSDIQQSLASSGMGNTTVGATMGLGVEREKRADMGRLEERLRQERIGLDTQLTGAQAQARQQMGSEAANMMAGLRGQGLGAQESLGTNMLGAQERGSANLQNVYQTNMANQLGLLGNLGERELAYASQLGQQGVDRARGADEANFAQWQTGQLGAQQLQEDFYNQLTGLQDKLGGNFLNTMASINVPYPSGDAQTAFGQMIGDTNSQLQMMRQMEKDRTAAQQNAVLGGVTGLAGSGMMAYGLSR